MQFPRRYAPNRFLFSVGLLSLVAWFSVLSSQLWRASAQSISAKPLAQSVFCGSSPVLRTPSGYRAGLLSGAESKRNC